MKTLSLKVPDALHSRLKAAAKRRSTNKSSLVREALEAYLGNEQRAGSFLDLTKDLLGTLKGPSDLSSNKKHMEGYGR